MLAETSLALALMVSAQNPAPADLLLDFDYLLTANTPYQTGLYRVYDAPVQTSGIEIYQVGTYCNVFLERIEYNTTRNGPTRLATSLGGGRYSIPDGVVNAINIEFEQRTWTRATCRLEVYRTGGGTTTPTGALVGVISYGGGFVSDASLAVPLQQQEMASYLLLVPDFCTGVQVISSGTMNNGNYTASTAGTAAEGVRFNVPASAVEVESIHVSLNGPRGSLCDIPVYGTPRP